MGAHDADQQLFFFIPTFFCFSLSLCLLTLSYDLFFLTVEENRRDTGFCPVKHGRWLNSCRPTVTREQRATSVLPRRFVEIGASNL